jgi:hypothetical protein
MLGSRRRGWLSRLPFECSARGACLAVSLLTLDACKAPRQTARASATPSASTNAVDAPATPAASAELDARTTALQGAFSAWTAATNAADSAALAQLYAPHLSLYGRIVSRAEALNRKLKYVADHPGFAQSVSDIRWEIQGEARVVRFRKTSSSAAAPATTVDAYLLWRELDGRFRIQDEGDVSSARKLSAQLDALRDNWQPKPYACPTCNNPELGDDTPVAGAPLGPDAVKGSGQVPAGAPEQVSYGRVIFPRFASAVDVPLFLTATAESGNGDGRWFYYATPDAVAKAAPGQDPDYLLYCAIGGFFSEGPLPANAKPDPGHVGDPKISFTTRFEKREHELYYERTIYGADGVMNFVNCTFSPAYEAYFHAIVTRMGHSLRAVSGGQAERVQRASQPYTPFDP